MNRIYRIIRNATTGQCAVASELAHARGKRGSLARAAASRVLLTAPALDATGRRVRHMPILFGTAMLAALSAFASHEAKAAHVTCNTTLYYCAYATNDDVTVITTAEGKTAPLGGFGVYLNSAQTVLNNVTITTSGSAADAVRTNSEATLFRANNLTIKATGASADGINLSSNFNNNYDGLVYVDGTATIEVVSGIAVRANNFQNAAANSVIILPSASRISVTGTGTAENDYSGDGYAVYAGNRNHDYNGLSTTDWLINGKRNNTLGNSYVFVGEDSNITTNTKNGHAVYANKGGLIQLGDGANVRTTNTGAYALYAATEKQELSRGSTEADNIRPGYIFLEGGATLRAENSAIVMQANGVGSVIASKAMAVPTIPSNVTRTDRVQGLDKTATVETSGVFDIEGKLDAVNGGEISLNMADGSILLGSTDNHAGEAVESVIDLNLEGATSQWKIDADSTLTRLTLGSGAALQYQANAIDIAVSDAITMETGGGVIDTNGFDQQLDEIIGGTGSLTKAGSGTLLFSAGNTYAGGTIIEAGTLQLGAGGTSGSIVGNVANNGTLAFNRSDEMTFAGTISSTGTVDQIGSGTTILSADNSYTGGTTIQAGTLQVGAGGTSGSIVGDVANDGTLVFNRSNEMTVAGTISGTGTVNQIGSGTTILSGANLYSGITSIEAGTLQAGAANSLSAASAVSVAAGTTLDLAGYDQTVSALANAGTVTMGTNTTPGTVLTVQGDYIGTGGTLVMNTALSDDSSATDKLVVEGDASGNTFVQVRNAGGAGAATDNGIQLVSVAGVSDGVFELQGRAVAGLYDYQLYKGGTNTPDDGGWYLRSEALPVTLVDPEVVDPPTPVLRPEPAAYLGNQNAALRMFQHTMHDRVGEPGLTARDDDGQGYAAWARVQNSNLDAGAVGGQIDIDTNTTLMQMGVEKQFAVGEGRVHAGLMGGYGRATTNGTSNLTGHKARGEVKGTSLGVYGTWFQNAAGPEGLYVDAWAQYGRFDNTVKGDYLGREQYDSRVWSGSIEAGYAMQVHSGERYGVYVEPQAQVIYTDYSSDDVREDNGTLVQTRKAGGTTTRLGARLYGRPQSAQYNRVQPFAAVNWWSGGNESTIAMDGERLGRDLPKNTYEAKVGAQLELGQGWSGWGQIGYQQGSNGYRDVNGQVGVKLSW